MLQTATIQIKLDPAMKQAVHSLYSSMGLTTTDAVKLFFKQSLNNNALPFEVKAPSGYFTPEEKEVPTVPGLIVVVDIFRVVNANMEAILVLEPPEVVTASVLK